MRHTIVVHVDVPETLRLSEEHACRALQDVIDAGLHDIARTNEDGPFASDDLATAANLTYHVVFPPDGVELDRVIEALAALLATDDSEELQFALDDLVFDMCGTNKASSDINNAGVAAQAKAVADRIGYESAIEELQALVDNWADSEPAT